MIVENSIFSLIYMLSYLILHKNDLARFNVGFLTENWLELPLICWGADMLCWRFPPGHSHNALLIIEPLSNFDIILSIFLIESISHLLWLHSFLMATLTDDVDPLLCC